MVKPTQKNQAKPAVSAAPKADDSEMLTLVKDAFKASRERDLQLSDNVLAMVIDRAKTWNDMSDTDKLDLLEKAEETSKAVSVTDPGISVIVKKLTADSLAMAEIDKLLEAERTKKKSAVSMLALLYRLFTQAEMDGMPMPGYDEKHAEGTPFRADKRSVKTGTGEPITVTWTNDLASALPQGKTADQDIADIAKEKASPNSVGRFKGLSKSDLKAIKSTADGNRNALRSLLRRAIKLHHRWMAIKKLNSVGIRWIKGDKASGIAMPTKLGLGELTAHVEMVSGSPKPIWIYDMADASEGRDFSVTQVNAFQPERISKTEDETMMAALIATAGKGGDDESGTDTEGTGENDTLDQAIGYWQRLSHFVNAVANKAVITKVMAEYKKNAQGADVMDLVHELDRVIHPMAEKTRHVYDQRQNAKLLNADNEAEAEAVA